MARNQQQSMNLLARFWRGWKRIARKVGQFQGRVVMTIFYFTIFAPFAIAIRWGSDPLAIKPGTNRGWSPIPLSDEPPLDQARKQS